MEFDCNIANDFPSDPLFHNPPSYASTDAEMDPEKAPLLFYVNKYHYLLADPSLVDDKDFSARPRCIFSTISKTTKILP
jgi:hypothetical protein